MQIQMENLLQWLYSHFEYNDNANAKAIVNE